MNRTGIAALAALVLCLSALASVATVASASEESGTPVECVGDSCQPLPLPPEEPVLGTGFLTPEGNPPPHYPRHRGRHPPGSRGDRRHSHEGGRHRGHR